MTTKEVELSMVIRKSLEIYDSFKNVIIKNNDEILNCDEKKKLSLLFGISITNNKVGDILKLLDFEYNVKFFLSPKFEDEYNKMYLEEFNFLDTYLIDNSTVEDLMLYLLHDSLIQNILFSRGIDILKLEKVINNMIEKTKSNGKILQKVI